MSSLTAKPVPRSSEKKALLSHHTDSESTTQKPPLKDLIKKALTAKLTKDEIVRLIKTSYYARPISKALAKELSLKESKLNDKRCLKHVRKVIDTPVESSSSQKLTPKQVTPSPKPTSSKTKANAPKARPQPPKEPKTPIKQESFKYLAPLKLEQSDLVNPCDDCLLPFSRLTSTTLPKVTFICGLPKIDRSIFATVLASRISTVKSHIKASKLAVPARLPKHIVSLIIHTLQRSIVKQLNETARKAKAPKKSKKSKKATTKAPPPKQPEFTLETHFVRGTDLPDKVVNPDPQPENTSDDTVRASYLLVTKIEHVLAKATLGLATLSDLKDLCPQQIKYEDNLYSTAPAERPVSSCVMIDTDLKAMKPNGKLNINQQWYYADGPTCLRNYLKARLTLLKIENNFGFEEALRSDVKLT
jgi:hypothetical protein